ncbi:M15 family metallopeptidase [Xanthobacter oligotrophicus]|uniref:M15 family metallopeptidase n=1 Tax=Xanthobacter oligotrophicus TaxID=2607286 RepID=UPI0011F345C8|nr:M15 family metallopeptidase [Xanthobacter oligotrophicus]MCG5237117.1 M15 family metallopeptidase [Xanthobacter oligotrophicus]
MVRVPEYEPSVSLRPSNQQNISIDTPPAAFGAEVGRGLQALAQGGMDAADAVVRVQELEDETVVRARRNEYIKAKDVLMYGDAGYMNSDGLSALDGFTKYRRDLDGLRREYGNGLTPSQQRLFARSVEPMELDAQRSGLTHRGKALKSLVVQEASSSAENFRNEAIRNYTDPNQWQKYTAAGVGEIRGLGQKLGWTAAKLKSEEQSYVSDVYRLTAAQISNDDPVRALDYLNQNRNAMLPEHYMHAMQSLMPTASGAVTRDAVTRHKDARTFLTGRLVQGHGDDHVNRLDQGFATNLAAMIQDAPSGIRDGLGILSGYRTVQRQQELWDDAVKKYGSPEAARKWVAPPGNSQHNHGSAIDLAYNGQSLAKAPKEVVDWVHTNAGKYGLHFPMTNEPWHIEPAGARGNDAGNVKPAGLMEAGNTDLANRPVGRNVDGTISTVQSLSIGEEGHAVLIPTVSPDGTVLSEAEAIAFYRQTGKHLGKFDTAANATAYTQALHQRQEREYGQPHSWVTFSPEVERALSGLPANYAQRLRDASAIGVKNALATDLAQAKAQRLEVVDSYKLRIAKEDEKLTQQEMVDDPSLDDGDKATLLNSYALKFNDAIATRQAIGAFQAGQLAIDPYSSDGRKLVDNVWTSLSSKVDREQLKPALLEVVRQTGLVPQPVVNAIRGDLSSRIIQNVASGATLAAQILAVNPASIERRDGGREVREAAETFSHLVNSVGLPQSAAAQRLIDMHDPEKVLARAALMKSDSIKDFIDKQATESSVRDIYDRGLFRFDPKLGETVAQSAAMVAEYKHILSESMVDASGDKDIAKSLAATRFRRLYGVSSFSASATGADTSGVITRLPPEVTYPAGADGSWDYIREQARSALATDGVSAKEIYLQADLLTNQDFLAGRPPRYSLWYRGEGGALEHYRKLFYAVPQNAEEVSAARRARLERRRDINRDVTEMERENGEALFRPYAISPSGR